MKEKNRRLVLGVGLMFMFLLMPALAEDIPLDSGEVQKIADVALLEERLDAFEKKLNNNLLNTIEINKQTLASVQVELAGVSALKQEVTTLKTLFFTMALAQVFLSFAVATYLVNRKLNGLQQKWEGLIIWVTNKLGEDPKALEEFAKSLPEGNLWDNKAFDSRQEFKLVPEEKKESIPKVRPRLDEEMPFEEISKSEMDRIRKKTKKPRTGGKIGDG